MSIRRRKDSPWLVIIETYKWPYDLGYDGAAIQVFGARVTVKCYPSNRVVTQRYVAELCPSREQAMQSANDLIVVIAEELALMSDE